MRKNLQANTFLGVVWGAPTKFHTARLRTYEKSDPKQSLEREEIKAGAFSWGREQKVVIVVKNKILKVC